MKNQIISAAVHRPWWALLFSLLLILGCAKGISKLGFSNDYRDYFSSANPQLVQWENLQNIFNKTDNVLIVVSAKTGDMFTRENLAVIEELTRLGSQIPYSSRVDSISNFQHVTATEGDNIAVADLVRNAKNLTDSELNIIRKVATEHPSTLNRVVNRAGTTTAVNVEVYLSDQPRVQIDEVTKKAYEIKAEFSEKYPHLAFHLSGSVLYNYAMTDATKKDMGSLMPLMYIGIFLLFFLITRSFFSTIASFIVVMASIFSMMGLAGWVGVVLMAPSISAPTIVFAMTIANCVHLVFTFFKAYKGGVTRAGALEETLKRNWTPVVLANITTAVGFALMNFSEVPPYRDLGNIVAMGLCLSVLFSFLLFPALMVLFPIKPNRMETQKTALHFLSNFVTLRYRSIIVTSFILIGFGVFGLTKLELNDKFIEWMDNRYEFRKDSDFINENLTGLYRIDWGLESGSENGIFSPEYLRIIDELAQWARQQPGVVHVDTISDTFKELNQRFHGDDASMYKMPSDPEMAAQLYLMYELSLPMGLDMNNRVNISKSSTRFVIRTSNLSTLELLALEAKTNEWIEENGLPTMVSEAASTTILFANISKRNIESLLTGNVIGLAVISLFLIIPLRSFAHGALSLVPNLIPVFVGFGVWGFLVGEVGLAISVVVGMTMGVLVDDTIHFMTRYMRNRRDGILDPAVNIKLTLEEVGSSLFATTVLLTFGFSLLMLSGFEVNKQMGTLSAIVFVVGFLADVLLLPSLLMLVDRKKTYKDLSNQIPASPIETSPNAG